MKKNDSKINVTKSFLPPLDEYVKEISTIWESHWLTNQGFIHEKFENALREYLGVNNVTLFVNGHMALDVAIKALNLKGEVITTPFTFASTTHAIVMNGLKPVFCDIKESNYTIDEDKIEDLITENTSAIIPVHVYGNPCNVKKIDEIAKKYGLKVIYDAAHVFGVEIDGVPIGSYGNVSMFSFHATKVFHSIEGGVLTYNNPSYKKGFDLYKNFGITGPEAVEAVGLNAKMNEFQAAMGITNLKYVDFEIAKRKKVAEIYRERLSKIKGINYLNDIEGVKHNYAYFPIIIDENLYGLNRDELYSKLQEKGIYARKYFYPLVTEFDCYKNLYRSDNIPVAKYISNRVLTLPMYGDLDRESIDYICDAIKIYSLG